MGGQANSENLQDKGSLPEGTLSCRESIYSLAMKCIKPPTPQTEVKQALKEVAKWWSQDFLALPSHLLCSTDTDFTHLLHQGCFCNIQLGFLCIRAPLPFLAGFGSFCLFSVKQGEGEAKEFNILVSTHFSQ